MADTNQQTIEDTEVKAAERADAASEGQVVEQPKAAEAPAPEEPKKKSVLTDEDMREMTLAARTAETTTLNPVQYNQSKIVAKDFFDSNALPKHIQNETQAFVTIVTGAEMGMKPMEAIQGLYIINGIITLWGKAVGRQLKKHGWKFKFTDESQEETTVTAWKGKSYVNPEDTDEQYTVTYKFADAQASKYTTDSYGKLKVGWLPGQNRKLKLRYGALSELLKTYLPEVLGQAADIAEVTQDYIEGEVVNEGDKPDAKAGIRAALQARKDAGDSPKVAPKAVNQEQGEAE